MGRSRRSAAIADACAVRLVGLFCGGLGLRHVRLGFGDVASGVRTRPRSRLRRSSLRTSPQVRPKRAPTWRRSAVAAAASDVADAASPASSAATAAASAAFRPRPATATVRSASRQIPSASAVVTAFAVSSVVAMEPSLSTAASVEGERSARVGSADWNGLSRPSAAPDRRRARSPRRSAERDPDRLLLGVLLERLEALVAAAEA